jgi:hypothetical protein
MKRKFLILAAILAVACWAPMAFANCTFDLTAINVEIGPAPYVQVVVDLIDSTHAEITATAYDGYKMGDGGAFGVNFNGVVTISSTNINGTFSDPTFYDPKTSIVPVSPGWPNPQGSDANDYTHYLANSTKNVDGWGDFNTVFSVKSFDSGDNFDVINFIATLTSGTWGTCEDVLLWDIEHGIYPAVAHVQNPITKETGYASVPLPPSVFLLGSGLLGLGLVGWRRKKS